MTTRTLKLGLLVASVGALAASWPPAAAAQAATGPAPGGPAAQALREGVEVRVLGGAGATTGGGAAASAVDESALRYYAARGERGKVDAEIARLRALHPGWQPPDDLWGPARTVDEGPLWRLYERGDYDAVRTEVARLERAKPGWTPPATLLALMEENEVRAELRAAEAAGDWDRLLEVAAAHPGEVACSRIDNMWRVAAAQAATGRRDAAYATYERIIADCPDVGHRIATLQKAKERVTPAQLEFLFAREETRAKSAAEEAKVAEARRGLTAPREPAAIRRLFAPGLTRAEAARAEPEVMNRRHAKGAESLGWFYYDSGDPRAAAAWFERAHAWAPGAETAKGLAVSRAAMGDFEGVDRLAARWPRELAQVLDGLRARRVAAAYEGGDHAAVLAMTAGTRRAGELMLRGWSLMKLERPTEALITFQQAAERAGDADNPGLRSEALYACALAHLATNTLREAVAMTEVPGVDAEHRRMIRAQVLDRQSVLAFERRDYRRARDYLQARYAFAEPSRDTLIREAWTWYHLRQPVRAEQIFARLHRQLATPETEEGLRVTRGRLDGIEYGPAPVRSRARTRWQP